LKGPIVVAGTLNQQYSWGLLSVEMGNNVHVFVYASQKGNSVATAISAWFGNLVQINFLKKSQGKLSGRRLENFPRSDKSKSLTLFHYPFF
jgi:hypothetical protein